VLAERLGMTRAELGMRMSAKEFVEWKYYDKWRNEKLEEERKKREKEMRLEQKLREAEERSRGLYRRRRF